MSCALSSLLLRLFSSCREWGLLSSCAVQVSQNCVFSCCGAQALGCMGFSSCSSRVPEHRLSSCVHGPSCSEACGVLLDQGSNPCLLHWQVGSLQLSRLGRPHMELAATILNSIALKGLNFLSIPPCLLPSSKLNGLRGPY